MSIPLQCGLFSVWVHRPLLNYCLVKTDNGITIGSIDPKYLTKETEKPEKTVRDIEVDGSYSTPDIVFSNISQYKRKAREARATGQRARKLQNKREAERRAQNYERDAQVNQDALMHGRVSTRKRWRRSDRNRQRNRQSLHQRKVRQHPPICEKLASIMLKLEKSTTKNGHPVWNLSGDTWAYKEAIKKAKGIWDGPRRLWSFYGTDDPADMIAKAIEDTYQHPSTALVASPASEAGKTGASPRYHASPYG